MPPKDAVLSIRVPADLADRLDALLAQIQRRWYSMPDMGPEAPGMMNRSKVARVALLRGVVSLEEEMKSHVP